MDKGTARVLRILLKDSQTFLRLCSHFADKKSKKELASAIENRKLLVKQLENEVINAK